MLCLSGFELYSRWVPLKLPKGSWWRLLTSCPSSGQLLATYCQRSLTIKSKRIKLQKKNSILLPVIYILLFLIGLNCDSSYFGPKLAWQAPT